MSHSDDPCPAGTRNTAWLRRPRSGRRSTTDVQLVMRHVEYPEIRYRVVVEVEHLFACRATAAHAVVGAVLLPVIERVDGRRRIDGAHPPAIHQVPCLEDLRHWPLRPLPAKVWRRPIGGAYHRDVMAVARRPACCSAPC